MKAAIIFGSKSDTEKMRGAASCLKEFGVEFEAHILSAHRVPEKLEEVLERLEKEGGRSNNSRCGTGSTSSRSNSIKNYSSGGRSTFGSGLGRS